MTKHIRKIDFSNLADVLGKIGEQKPVIKGKDQWVYPDQTKVYARLDKDRLITMEGKEGKYSKNLTAEALIELAKTTLESAIDERGYIPAAQLGQVVSGLENLRNRMEVYQTKMSPVKRLILKLFGVVDKTDALVSTVEKMIQTAKTRQLNIDIQQLNKEIGTLKTEIQQLEAEQKEKSPQALKQVVNFLRGKTTLPKDNSAQLKEKKAVLSEKEADLRAKEAELKKISGPEDIELPTQSKPTSKEKTATEPLSSLFQLPDEPGTDIYRVESQLIFEIKSNLGLTSTQKKHETFLRKLIFGFSVGQKQTMEEMAASDPSFNVEELQKMLEGGTGLDNLYFVAHYLDKHLSTAESQGKDPKVLDKLKRLQSDVKRSLPIALKLRAIESSKSHHEENMNALVLTVKAELAQMKPGERLLIPVGTGDHETLLCLQKKEDGSIETSYYNTGDGVEKNMASGFKLKALTDFLSRGLRGRYPVKKTFPTVPLDSSEVKKMLVSVLGNRIKEGSIDDLNGHLESHLGKGMSGDPKEVQINGVCSFQVLSEAFQDILEPEEAYLSFQHDFLIHLRLDFQKTTQKRMKQGIRPGPMEQTLNQKLLDDTETEIQQIEKKLAG